MRKLTDEELSMVLSRHAAGQLTHFTFGYQECGCVGGTIAPREDDWFCIPRRAVEVSDALSRALGWWRPGVTQFQNYPVETDDMLRLLEKAGLA